MVWSQGGAASSGPDAAVEATAVQPPDQRKADDNASDVTGQQHSGRAEPRPSHPAAPLDGTVVRHSIGEVKDSGRFRWVGAIERKYPICRDHARTVCRDHCTWTPAAPHR